MKNVIKSIVIAAVLFFNVNAKAQSAPKLENSLLWEVSGNGLSKPSYLYGTIHMICSGDYFLTEKTKKAFDASSKLVLEINLADPKQVLEMQQMAMGKEPLSKKLNSEQLAKLDEILKRTTGMAVQQVDSFNLMTIVSLVGMKSFGCNDLKFYELEFIEQAKKKNMTFDGFETVKSQFAIFDQAYSDDEMINMLDKSEPKETYKLVSEYKTENINGVFDVVTDQKAMSEKTRKLILDNRNLNWIKIMPELMKSESVFFAVGSGHLGGEFGVINLLRKAGYSVKPVLN